VPAWGFSRYRELAGATRASAALVPKTEANHTGQIHRPSTTKLEEKLQLHSDPSRHQPTLPQALTHQSPYPLPRDRGPRESRPPVTARHVGVPSLYKNPSLHGKPNFQQAARPNSTSIHPYPKRGQIQSDNRLNPASFAECSIWCRLQSWAHIQIQHLLVPG